MPPVKSNHPVAAKKPPSTGNGMNRTRLPNLKYPSSRKQTPVNAVEEMAMVAKMFEKIASGDAETRICARDTAITAEIAVGR